MEGNERLLQGLEVFRPDGYSEPIDDGGENLQQFGNAAVDVRFIEKLVEGAVDDFANDGSTIGETAIDTVCHGFEAFPFTRVDRIEKRYESDEKRGGDAMLTNGRIDLLRQHLWFISLLLAYNVQQDFVQ